MSGAFRYDTRIRFSQVDAAGILFFSRAFEICHEAYEALAVAHGFGLTPERFAGPWVLPLVHAEVDFRSPLRLGDAVVIEIGVERMGRSSVTFVFRLSKPSGVVCATVRHVHAAVDRRSFRSRDLPDEVRSLQGMTLPESGGEEDV